MPEFKDKAFTHETADEAYDAICQFTRVLRAT
jgi:hypothetical protein